MLNINMRKLLIRIIKIVFTAPRKNYYLLNHENKTPGPCLVISSAKDTVAT